jgi:hypothetical protein
MGCQRTNDLSSPGTLPKRADHRTIKTSSIKRHPPPCCQHRPCPRTLGSQVQGRRKVQVQAEFPSKVCKQLSGHCPPRPRPALATYPDAMGVWLGRCWRRRYNPDAASAPSRAAMAGPQSSRGGGRAAWCTGRRQTPGLGAVTGRGHLRQAPRRDPRVAPPPRWAGAHVSLWISEGQRDQLQIEKILFVPAGAAR